MRIVHTLPAPVDVENGQVIESLRRLATDGLARIGTVAYRESASEQLEWELQRITGSGRASQFLLLRDIILLAKEKGIPVSPGYGRLGNSVLAFALGLCEPDPYAHGLVIARSSHSFQGAFGINVSANRAHELIDYVKSKFAVVDSCTPVDLVELPALDLMQVVMDRAGKVGEAGFWAEVPLDDTATFNLLGQGDTKGVYQLGSEQARNCLRDWKPTEFNDLLVLTTLNRYGTEELIPEIIAAKRRGGSGCCADPMLEAVTSESFGFVVWQEQVIRALMELAGVDGNKGDTMRRVLGRKRPNEIGEARERFVSECVLRKDVPEYRALAVWNELEKYSKYAINKAHVVAHGLLTYRMAYLKAHWRDTFDAATRESGG